MVHTHLFHHFSYSSVEPTIGQGVTDSVIQECPSFYYEEVPIYYDSGHRQLKDEERFVSDKLDLSVTACLALERNTRDQANSLILMEQRKKRVTAFKSYDVYSWKRGKGRHAENFVSEGSTPSIFVQRRLNQVKCTSKLLGKKYLEYILLP